MTHVMERNDMLADSVKTWREVLTMVKNSGLSFVVLKFCDNTGSWNQQVIQAKKLVEKSLFSGIDLVNGLVAFPNPHSASLNPFQDPPTLSLVCEVKLVNAGHACLPSFLF